MTYQVDVTGIANATNKEMAITPISPSINGIEFYTQCSTERELQYFVFSVDGREVSNGVLTSTTGLSKHRLDVNENGIYILKIKAQNSNNFETFKTVVW